MTEYFNARALQSARSSGFKSTSHAVAELIDNSFDAEASTVKIIYVERANDKGRSSVQEIIVADDGIGMPKDLLQHCLTFGGTGNEDLEEIVSKKKLGKFGFGLPNSSLSQCPHVVVYSWQDSQRPYSVSLDLARCLKEDSIEVPEPTQDDLPESFKTLKAAITKKQGTIIHWKNCDRLSHKWAKTLIKHAEEHLGRIYRRLLDSDRKIVFQAVQHNSRQDKFSTLIDATEAVANDPLFLTEECVLAKKLFDEASDDRGNANPLVREHYKPFVIDQSKCKATNEELDEHCYPWSFKWQGKEFQFEITTTVACKNIQKPGVRTGGKTAVGRHYADKEELGSISFLRSDREISCGRYGLYHTRDTRQRWWSIEVRFSPDADDLLGVANNKQDIAFQKIDTELSDYGEEFHEYESNEQEAKDELWKKLAKILAIAQRAALKKVIKDESQFDLDNTASADDDNPLPGQNTGTTEATIRTDGQRKAELSDKEREELLEKLSSKYAEIDPEVIRRAIENFSQSRVRGILLYAPMPGVDQLWSLTPVANFLIIMVNAEHEFYTNILKPMKVNNQNTALSSLELFISSLAWDEYQNFWADDTQKDLLEAFRSHVGIHLRRYIRENGICLTESDFDSYEDENTE